MFVEFKSYPFTKHPPMPKLQFFYPYRNLTPNKAKIIAYLKFIMSSLGIINSNLLLLFNNYIKN